MEFEVVGSFPSPLALALTLTLTLTLTFKLGWHDTQVMPNLKPAMGDSTVHSVSVAAVVSERQAENHFSRN